MVFDNNSVVCVHLASLESTRSPDLLSCPEPDHEGDLFAFIFDTIIVGTLCIIGVVCNVIAIAAFVNGKQTTTTCILIALSVADILYLLTHGLMFQALRSIYPYTGVFKSYLDIWPYIEVWEFPFGVTFQTMSIYCVVLVAMDRYIGVCWPLHARAWCTKKRARIHVIAISVFVFALNSPRFFVQKPVEVFDNCTCTVQAVMVADKLGKSKLFNMIMGPVYLTVIDLLPVVILIVINLRLFWAIRASSRLKLLLYDKDGTTSVTKRHNSTQERRWTLMLCVIIAVFLICQTPISINHLMYAAQWTMEPKSQRYYNVLTNTLAAFNATCNFFVYIILGRRFREQLRALCSKKQTYRRSSTSTTATKRSAQYSTRLFSSDKNKLSGINDSFV